MMLSFLELTVKLYSELVFMNVSGLSNYVYVGFQNCTTVEDKDGVLYFGSYYLPYISKLYLGKIKS
jgi:hypothetical protein